MTSEELNDLTLKNTKSSLKCSREDDFPDISDDWDLTYDEVWYNKSDDQKLKELDEVAYLRFASVYGCFSTVQQFKEVIENLQELDDEDEIYEDECNKSIFSK